MGRFSALIHLYTQRRTVGVTVALCLLFDVIALLRVFYPPAFEFLIGHHVFEAVAILALSQLLLLSVQIANTAGRRVVLSDRDGRKELLEYLARNPSAALVRVYSAGLGANVSVLHEIIAPPSRLQLEVLVQHPDLHLDREDAARLRAQLALITRDMPSAQSFEIRQSRVPAGIRAWIVCDSSGRPMWATASWYVYNTSTSGVSIKGRGNPSFILDAMKDADEQITLKWLNDRFALAWDDARNDVAYHHP